MQLTDLRDGRLYIDDQVILLAPHAGVRLTAYLKHRSSRWPNTANPHVFINHMIATGVAQTTYAWVNKVLGFHAQELREDRILDEVRASAGDLRRVCDMFGLTVNGCTSLHQDAWSFRPAGATPRRGLLLRPPIHLSRVVVEDELHSDGACSPAARRSMRRRSRCRSEVVFA
jgi:hypothetical protein